MPITVEKEDNAQPILWALLVMLIFVGLLVWLWSASSGGNIPSPKIIPLPTIQPTTITLPQQPVIRPPPAPLQATTATQVPILPTQVPVPTIRPVDFSLDPGSQTKCGLTCRDTTATITNTGGMTAHNVCVQLTVYNSNDKLIKLNGEQNIQRCVGDIQPGQSKSEPIHIEADCGFLFGDCNGKTLTIKCMVTSTEKTIYFPDQIITT
jgi:hypothetical protein